MTKKKDNRGGAKIPGPGKTQGRPPMPPEEKKVRVSTMLAPGSKERAVAVQRILGLSSWSRTLETALFLMIESSPELKAKLEEMGLGYE